jgi:hypothetical protein
MTPNQRELVQTSFAELTPSAGAVAAVFYREPFALAPSCASSSAATSPTKGKS